MTAPTDPLAPTADPLRLEVHRGGTPPPEQLAAVVAVLTARRAAPASAPPTGAAMAPWARAALLEGIGARIVEEPADLVWRPGQG